MEMIINHTVTRVTIDGNAYDICNETNKAFWYIEGHKNAGEFKTREDAISYIQSGALNG